MRRVPQVEAAADGSVVPATPPARLSLPGTPGSWRGGTPEVLSTPQSHRDGSQGTSTRALRAEALWHAAAPSAQGKVRTPCSRCDAAPVVLYILVTPCSRCDAAPVALYIIMTPRTLLGSPPLSFPAPPVECALTA